MAKFQLKEPTVDAFKITAETYTLDDGSTKPVFAATDIGSYYVINADGSTQVIAAVDFEAKYAPLS